jgi:hypothetical protein
LRYLANFLCVVATLFATTPGLPIYARTVLLDGACPCRCGMDAHDEHHHHDGPCEPGCHCAQCRHRAAAHSAASPERPGEDGSVLEPSGCPYCPFCPTGNCNRCCTCQAPPCLLPPPLMAVGPAPCLSRLALEAAPAFPPPLPGSLIRPPRA